MKECSEQNSAPLPKGIPVLIPRTCEYVMYHVTRDSAHVTKIKGFEIGSLSWIFQVSLVWPQESLEEGVRRVRDTEGDVIIEEEARALLQWPRNVCSP